MNSIRPTAVAFDLDGLMFNTEELYQEVGSELLRRRGRVFDDELLLQMMGRPSHVALQIMIERHGLAETVESLLAESDSIFAGILDARLAPLPGVMELMAALERSGIPKAVATSSRRWFAEMVLGRFELNPRFEFILASEDVTQGKPHPEIYASAARRLGVSPPQLMVLEDSQNGCRAAMAAGSFVVAVPGPHSRGHSYEGVNLIARSLEDPRIYAALGLPPRRE
jgi:HAD superfamily hydrolase (TIGR01509 family)